MTTEAAAPATMTAFDVYRAVSAWVFSTAEAIGVTPSSLLVRVEEDTYVGHGDATAHVDFAAAVSILVYGEGPDEQRIPASQADAFHLFCELTGLGSAKDEIGNRTIAWQVRTFTDPEDCPRVLGVPVEVNVHASHRGE